MALRQRKISGSHIGLICNSLRHQTCTHEVNFQESQLADILKYGEAIQKGMNFEVRLKERLEKGQTSNCVHKTSFNLAKMNEYQKTEKVLEKQ
jgi:hypothetical protein